MFAGVKYSRPCTGHKNLQVINVSEIVCKSFNPKLEHQNKEKLYNIKCKHGDKGKCQAFILFVKDLKKEATEKMNSTRPKYPPLSVAQPATSDSDLDKIQKVSAKKPLKRIFDSPPAQTSEFLKSKIAKLQEQNLSTSDEDSADDVIEKGKVTVRSVEVLKKPIDNFKPNKPVDKLEEEIYNSDSSIDRYSEKDELNTNSEFNKLKKQIQTLQTELKEKNKKLDDLSRLNVNLQDKLLSRFDALDKNVEDFEKESAHAAGKETFAKVGAIKKQNIHLGRNILLKKSKFDAVSMDAKSPQTFICHLAEACYGFNTLINSSVTGKASNRNKKLNPKARPRLDPRILSAIQEAFTCWARSCSPPHEEVDISFYKNEVPTLLSKYISKLRDKHCKKVVIPANSDENANTDPLNLEDKEVHDENTLTTETVTDNHNSCTDENANDDLLPNSNDNVKFIDENRNGVEETTTSTEFSTEIILGEENGDDTDKEEDIE